MRILIEEYLYDLADVAEVLDGLFTLQDVEQKVSVSYVGYYYNPHENVRDIVFILPKVLIDERGLVFGKYNPKDIINIEEAKIEDKYRKFLYNFSVWIHRAIVVYKESHEKSGIVLHRQIESANKGTHKKKSNTLLDVILSLIHFNKENQQFFTFILKNIHSGFNKINWGATVAKTSAIIEDGAPVYLNPINKKRQINFDEELIVIFFSILNHIAETYGYRVNINFGFSLIKGAKFERYLNGYGRTRLRQIKHKYFSDIAVKMWNLCYAFFDKAHMIRLDLTQSEYLLVKSFHIVFEAMIDELIGTPHDQLPKGLADQYDGKVVDHLYTYKGLLANDKVDDDIYYIGDSKYYKIGNGLEKKSIYKQNTYARNVIQWNLDLWLNGKVDTSDDFQNIQIFDPLTEGYNIIPNFFISAAIDNETLSYEDNIIPHEEQYPINVQFKNRLYDRDTLLLSRYNVNFLFIVALYGRNKTSNKDDWKRKVREMFRTETQQVLKEHYNFYVMTAKEGVSASNYIEEHFQQLLGKIFNPYEDREHQKYYSLALDNGKEFDDENETILAQLRDSFYVEKCSLGDDPRELLPEVAPLSNRMAIQDDQFLTMHHLEKYMDKNVVVGCYKDQKHLDWILGKNDKESLIYNIRLGTERRGGQVKAKMDKKAVFFAILYEYGHEYENRYRVFRVHHHAVMTAERLKKSLYPHDPKSKKYFCYVFDEEVTLGNIDINELLSSERIYNKTYEEGEPIFKTCEELIKYRK